MFGQTCPSENTECVCRSETMVTPPSMFGKIISLPKSSSSFVEYTAPWPNVSEDNRSDISKKTDFIKTS